jgi:AcrR family transcriptional regulator
MPLQKVTKEEILQKAHALFCRQGYFRTSMSDLGQAVGLMKGSFYHYFASKEELMQEVLESLRHRLAQQAFQHAYTAGSARERLRRLHAGLVPTLFQVPGGCIAGNTSLEAAKLVPEFQVILQGIFRDWLNAYEHLFGEAHEPETATELACRAVAELEGALLLSNLFQDSSYVEKALIRVESVLE